MNARTFRRKNGDFRTNKERDKPKPKVRGLWFREIIKKFAHK